MKKLENSLKIILVYSLFTACTTSDSDQVQGIHHIDLNSNTDEITYRLEDYATDIKMIKLETRPETMMNYFRGYVGDQYIIHLGREKVISFDSNGKFIGVIANKGKGPQEFNSIDAWTYDENQQVFYYHDREKNHIKVYSLEKNQYLADVPFESQGSLDQIILVNDSTLAVYPGQFASYGYLYFYQDLDGNILGGKKKKDTPHPGAWAGMSDVFLPGPENDLLLHLSESDTVYRLNQDTFQPFLAIKQEQTQKNGNVTTGTVVQLRHFHQPQVYLSKVGFEKEITPNMARMNTIDYKNHIYNLSEKKSYYLTRLYHNCLGVDIDFPRYINFQSGSNKIVLVYQASELIEMVEKRLEGLSDQEQKNVQKHLSDLKFDDNPVLVIARLN